MRSHTKRLVVPIAWSGLGILILGLLVLASTVQARTNTASKAALEPSWSTILIDQFDETATPSRRINHTGSANYQWGEVRTSSLGFTDTLWCVAGGDGASLTPGQDTYTKNVTTTVIYGPLDLKNVISAELQLSHWFSVADGDGLEWGWSTNDDTYTFYTVTTQTVNDWRTKVISSETSTPLRNLMGQPQVYVAFRFHSNGDNNVGKGIFLDDVQLRVQYRVDLFMPVVYLQPTPTSTPTPTPIPDFRDDFSNEESGWPKDFFIRNLWSQNFYGGYSNSFTPRLVLESLQDRYPSATITQLHEKSSDLVYQIQPSDGTPPQVLSMPTPPPGVYYAVVHKDGNRVFATSSYRTPSGDFVYELDARLHGVREENRGDGFGILISQVPVAPVPDPWSFDQPVKGYAFQIEINPKDGGYDQAGWVIRRWDTRSSGQDIKGPHTTPLVNSSPDHWTKLRLERVGSRITVYVDGQYIASTEDSTYTGPMYIGLYGQHCKGGITQLSYDILLEWDNVFVHPQ